MNANFLLLFYLFIQTGNSQDRVACPMKETLLRNLRFGSRELLLAARLANDQLGLENAAMENEIARLSHRDEDQNLDIIPLDRFLIEQDKLASP